MFTQRSTTKMHMFNLISCFVRLHLLRLALKRIPQRNKQQCVLYVHIYVLKVITRVSVLAIISLDWVRVLQCQHLERLRDSLSSSAGYYTTVNSISVIVFLWKPSAAVDRSSPRCATCHSLFNKIASVCIHCSLWANEKQKRLEQTRMMCLLDHRLQHRSKAIQCVYAVTCELLNLLSTV